MKQLSGIDATFLYMETPETPMHVAGLTLYEPPKNLSGSFYDHFRAFFASRVHLIPIFSKKLARAAFDLDHPGWVDAGPLDLDYHIRHAKLPKPGTFAQLETMIGDLHSVVLDRSRPLWQFTVIDGLEDGQFAVYSKVHHAAVDGGAGMVITKALYDLTETPRDVGPAPAPKEKQAKPTLEQRALVGLNDLMANMIRQHITFMTTGAKLLGSVASALLPGASSGEAKPAGAPALPTWLPPKTPFNVTISGQRSYAARALSLRDAKLVAKATGTKLNDVVMAVCGGALREYLLAKKKLPKTPLVAFVPISLREAGNTDINNQVFGMTCPLGTDVADPLERLISIQKTSSTSKSVAGVTKDAAPKDFTMIGAPLLLPGLIQFFGKLGLADLAPGAANVTISNVPGPPVPLYGGGAKVTALYPVSIPTHGIALNFTVQSYVEDLDFGLTADRKAVPDIALMADALKPALDELVAAVKAKMAAADAALSTPPAPAKAVRAAAPAAAGSSVKGAGKSPKAVSKRAATTQSRAKTAAKAPAAKKPAAKKPAARKARTSAR